MFDYISKLISM